MPGSAEDPPTLGEVLRRLEVVATQLGGIAREIKEDRAAAASTYVRQDVYLAERRASSAVVADLHGDIQVVRAEVGSEIQGIKTDLKADRGWRRQMWLAIGVAFAASLLSVIGFILQYMAVAR